VLAEHGLSGEADERADLVPGEAGVAAFGDGLVEGGGTGDLQGYGLGDASPGRVSYVVHSGHLHLVLVG
jgi:hypothetical protein